MTAKITLSAKAVLEAARNAFDEGILQAQVRGGEPGQGVTCSYRDRWGSACAVGAGMTDDQVAVLRKQRRVWEYGEGRESGNITAIQTLIDKGAIEIEEGTLGRNALMAVQEKHDHCLGVVMADRKSWLKELSTEIDAQLAKFKVAA